MGESDPRIRVLPPTLADQIAAGEVVERPASVVKELVENALDAGARRIDIDVEAGGRQLIRVVDDGGGMSPAEARLALRRHATSKITHADDLWSLRTFGFRGEALPSIAAVARLTLRTKMSSTLAGFSLLVEGGVEASASEVGMPTGTQVEVRDLFFNTPARQKFLKSEATESANVSEAVLRLALAHPETHFKLRLNGRPALDLPVHRELGERARAALARRGAGLLHEALGEEGGHHIHAFLAGPDEASATARSTFLFVGRRFVRDRALLSALSMGYGPLLEKGRYPLAALFVELPGQDLDINVHPQKLEVRFARAQEVYAAVRHVIAAAVGRAPWLPSAPSRTFTLPIDRGAQQDRGSGLEVVPAAGRLRAPTGVTSGLTPGLTPGLTRGFTPGVTRGLTPGSSSVVRSSAAGTWSVATASGAAALADALGDVAVAHAAGAWSPVNIADIPVGAAATDVEVGGVPLPSVDAPAAQPGFFAGLEYIGQLHRSYLMCQAPDELLLLDQHAAQECVALENLRSAHRSGAIPQQRLLFPIPIEVDERAVETIRRPHLQSVLQSLGLGLENFGPTTLLVRALPELLRDVDPKPLVIAVLAHFANAERAGAAELPLLRILATMACHGVMRPGDLLSRQQAEALLGRLDGVDLQSHCPQGRTVALRLFLPEIERRFGRS